MKKRILGIFICLLVIFLMSHNVSALTLTQDVSLLSVYSTGMSVAGPGIYVENQEIVAPQGAGSMVTAFALHFRNMSCAAGNYLQTNINVFRLVDNDALNTWVNSLYGGNSDFSFIDTEYEQLTQNTAQIRLTLACTTTFTNQNKILSLNSTTSNMLYLYQYDNLSVIYTSRFKVNNTAVDAHETAENLYQINQKIDTLLNDLTNSINSLSDVNDNLEDINDTLKQQQQDEVDALDDATDDAQAGADDSAQDAANATTGLISVIGGFVSAVTSATPSDCNINGNIGHLNMGTLDMCSLPVPSFVQVIGSIILILVCIPFVIIMFNRFISLFRSFQG